MGKMLKSVFAGTVQLVTACLLSVVAVPAAADCKTGGGGGSDLRDVTELGVRNDGGADAAAPLNAALKAGNLNLFFPAGEYRLEGQLVLPSHAHLVADPAARIYAGLNCAPHPVVVNSDPEKGNEDISIRGGLWDGCAPFHPRRGWADPDYPARFFHFIKVKGFTLEKLKMKDGVAYHISLGQIRNFRVEDIEFIGVFPVKCQDGVHICGGCEDGLVRNIRCPVRGATYDDLIAVNSDDCQFYSHQSGQIDAPIRRIRIENVEAISCHSVVRLLSVRSPIEDVVFRNIRGGYREFGINADAARYCADPIFKDADHPAGVGCLRNVLFENCEMWYDGPRPNPKEVVDFEENGTGVRFRNFRHAREKEKPGLKPRPTFRFRKLDEASLVVDGRPVEMKRGEEKTFDDVRDLDFSTSAK